MMSCPGITAAVTVGFMSQVELGGVSDEVLHFCFTDRNESRAPLSTSSVDINIADNIHMVPFSHILHLMIYY